MSLQELGGQTGSMALGKLFTEHHQNKRNHHRLQKRQCSPGPTLHQWGHSGTGPLIQVPGGPRQRRSFLACKHHSSGEEDSVTTSLPESTQEKQPGG